MVTASLPRSEYSSAYRPVAGGGGTSSAANTTDSGVIKTSPQETAPAIKNAALNTVDSLNDLNPFSTKNAPLPEERSVLLGMFNDVLKTLSKILTGPMLTDALKGLLKDGGQTWEQVIYRSCMDSLPSRFVTDVVNSFMVRLFNGNHKIFGIPLYLPPEVSSQIFAIPTVLMCRSATKDDGVNANSAKDNISKEEAVIRDTLKDSNHWFIQFSDWLSDNFKLYVRPVCDKAFKLMLGIHGGEKLKDKEGNFILDKDGKPLEANPTINKKHLFGFIGATYFGSFFLPRFTTSFGFEKARSPLRAVFATLTTTLCRINTTILHNGSGMARTGGKNFDACYKTSVVEKTLVPLVQYTCDALGAMLSTTIPINGATIANTLRLITEIPTTFLSSGLVNVAKKDRMDPSWSYLGYKICRPFLNVVEATCRPLFELIGRYVYGPLLGMFDSKIPNMYGVDIRTKETKKRDHLSPAMEAKFKNAFGGTFGLFIRKHLELPGDIIKLFRRCANDSVEAVAKLNKKIEDANAAIDLRKEAEIALKTSGIETFFKPTDASKEINEKIVEAVKSNNKETLITLLNAKPVLVAA